MNSLKRLINRLVGLIRKRKKDDFYLTDLDITEQDETNYQAWARKKNELVRQKFRSKRK